MVISASLLSFISQLSASGVGVGAVAFPGKGHRVATLSPWAQQVFLAVVPVAPLPKQAVNMDAVCPRLPLALLPSSCGDRDEVCGLPGGWRALEMHFTDPVFSFQGSQPT